jgi:mannosyltransferase
LMVLPMLLCTVVVVSLGYSLWPRFFFFVFGFAVLVLISGTMQLGQWGGRIFSLDTKAKDFVGASLCAVLILLSAISIPPVYGPKQDFEGALQFIEEVKGADDAVVTIGATIFPYDRLYKTDWKSTRSLETLDMIRSSVQRTWLLYTMPVHLEAKSPEIWRAVNREFEIVKEFPGTLRGGRIFVCRFIKPSISPNGNFRHG